MDVPIERQTFENDETVVGKYAKACRCDKAIEYYKRSMEMQKKPRYTDASMAIAQICEITGDVVGAIEAWEQYIGILNEDWNTSEGAYVERARRKIQALKNRRRRLTD